MRRRDKNKDVRKKALSALARPLRHLWDASETYNDRWFESRAELYALLMGRQRRLGKGSVIKWIAGNHIVLRRIAEYALAPVSYLDLRDFYFCIDFWNKSTGPAAPGPRARRGRAASLTEHPTEEFSSFSSHEHTWPVSAPSASRGSVSCALIGRVTIRPIVPSIRKWSPTNCCGSSPNIAEICARCA